MDYFRLLANWIHEQSCPLAELSALWKIFKSYFQFASKSWAMSADLLNWDIILSKNMIKETENTMHENLFIQCNFQRQTTTTKGFYSVNLAICSFSTIVSIYEYAHLYLVQYPYPHAFLSVPDPSVTEMSRLWVTAAVDPLTCFNQPVRTHHPKKHKQPAAGKLSACACEGGHGLLENPGIFITVMEWERAHT